MVDSVSSEAAPEPSNIPGGSAGSHAVAESMSEEVTTGASNDLQQVRSLARRMIAQWGFRATTNKSVLDAPIAWESPQGGGMGQPQMASGETERQIDIEVKALVQGAYDLCTKTLGENKVLMDQLADALIETETVDAPTLQKMVVEHTAQALSALDAEPTMEPAM